MSSEDRNIPVRWGRTMSGDDSAEDQGEHEDGLASQQKSHWVGKDGFTGSHIVSKGLT